MLLIVHKVFLLAPCSIEYLSLSIEKDEICVVDQRIYLMKWILKIKSWLFYILFFGFLFFQPLGVYTMLINIHDLEGGKLVLTTSIRLYNM